MIKRYARKEMTEIWSAATKYRIWFEIEAHGCDALAELLNLMSPKSMRLSAKLNMTSSPS